MVQRMSQHDAQMWGNRGTIRLLMPGELPLYLNHLLRLDEEARELRFDQIMDDTAIQAHCLKLSTGGAQIIGAFIDDALRGAVELNAAPDPDLAATELMFSVEPAFQCQGIGTRLMAKALETIQPKPTVMFCRERNLGMIALAESFGAKIWRADDYLALAIITDDGNGALPRHDVPDGPEAQGCHV